MFRFQSYFREDGSVGRAHWGAGHGQNIELTPPGAPPTRGRPTVSQASGMMVSQHQKIQSERKGKRQILSATSNRGEPMLAFSMDFLVSCGILIVPHALG